MEEIRDTELDPGFKDEVAREMTEAFIAGSE